MVPTKNLLYNLYIMVLINISGVAALIACRNEKINRVYYLYSQTLSNVSPLRRKTTDLIAKTFRLTSAHQVERIDGQVISVIFASERSHPATTSYGLLCPIWRPPGPHSCLPITVPTLLLPLPLINHTCKKANYIQQSDIDTESCLALKDKYDNLFCMKS